VIGRTLAPGGVAWLTDRGRVGIEGFARTAAECGMAVVAANRASLPSLGMDDSVRIVREPVSRAELREIAEALFGDMVKGVVDVARGVMAIGGELHADEEAALLDDGSRQADLWGINLYPGEAGEGWLEFDSMINVRPSQGNRSRGVEDEALRERIRDLVRALVPDE
jgi:hypothetical protein